MLQSQYLLTKIGFDEAENEPSKVWQMFTSIQTFTCKMSNKRIFAAKNSFSQRAADAGSVERDSISASGTERFASCTSFDLARA